MTKWQINACPRCGGSMYREQDPREDYVDICLICSYRRSVTSMVKLEELEKKYFHDMEIMVGKDEIYRL